MDQTLPQSAARPAVSPGALVAWIAGGSVLSLAVTALVVVAAGNQPGWWQAWAASSAALLVATVGSLPLLLLALKLVQTREGLYKAMPLVLIAGAVRMIVFIGVALLAINALQTPKWPTFGFIAGMYAVLLGVEVATIGRAFWQADTVGPPSPPKASPPAQATGAKQPAQG